MQAGLAATRGTRLERLPTRPGGRSAGRHEVVLRQDAAQQDLFRAAHSREGGVRCSLTLRRVEPYRYVRELISLDFVNGRAVAQSDGVVGDAAVVDICPGRNHVDVPGVRLDAELPRAAIPVEHLASHAVDVVHGLQDVLSQVQPHALVDGYGGGQWAPVCPELVSLVVVGPMIRWPSDSMTPKLTAALSSLRSLITQ